MSETRQKERNKTYDSFVGKTMIDFSLEHQRVFENARSEGIIPLKVIQQYFPQWKEMCLLKIQKAVELFGLGAIFGGLNEKVLFLPSLVGLDKDDDLSTSSILINPPPSSIPGIFMQLYKENGSLRMGLFLLVY